MSVNSSTLPPVLPPPVSAERGEQFLERQLRRTRRHVKLTDLAAVCVQLLAAVLAFLFVLVVIDHWLFGLGFWGRTLAFAVLVFGVVWYVAVRILPLLVRPINPIYAAWTIEQSTPSLKNSLINFLLFRANRTAIHPGVFEAIQDRATADIRRVSIDSAVDRSRLITAGYVLAGLLTLGAVYTILSPKDPFQTVLRVTAPWADIARPSRVEIAEVLPGDAEVYQGAADHRVGRRARRRSGRTRDARVQHGGWPSERAVGGDETRERRAALRSSAASRRGRNPAGDRLPGPRG